MKTSDKNKENKTEEGLMEIKVYGYEAIEKTAMLAGTTSRVYLPVNWSGKKIKIIRMEK